MQMMFGGQRDNTDFHWIGFDLEILVVYLHMAGFEDIRRVPNFGLFQDSSIQDFHSIPISLNVEARKKAITPWAVAVWRVSWNRHSPVIRCSSNRLLVYFIPPFPSAAHNFLL